MTTDQKNMLVSIANGVLGASKVYRDGKLTAKELERHGFLSAESALGSNNREVLRCQITPAGRDWIDTYMPSSSATG